MDPDEVNNMEELSRMDKLDGEMEEAKAMRIYPKRILSLGPPSQLWEGFGVKGVEGMGEWRRCYFKVVRGWCEKLGEE